MLRISAADSGEYGTGSEGVIDFRLEDVVRIGNESISSLRIVDIASYDAWARSRQWAHAQSRYDARRAGGPCYVWASIGIRIGSQSARVDRCAEPRKGRPSSARMDASATMRQPMVAAKTQRKASAAPTPASTPPPQSPR